MDKESEETVPVTEAAIASAGTTNPPVLDPVPIGEQTGIDGIPVGVGGGIGEMAGLQGDPSEGDENSLNNGGLVRVGGGIGQMADLTENAPAEGV